ncbi:MAG: hypothetical protein IKT71_00160 [Paludibacteraceae bacterium]|nr:hypothetical protein [Paludibacteraceae bacterium]
MGPKYTSFGVDIKIDSEKSGNDIPHIIGTVWGMGSVGAAGSTGVASDESIFCSGYSGGC